MSTCLEEEEIFALVDGAASEKDAAVWRKHVAGCERCTKAVTTLEHALAVIAEDEPLDVGAHADAVMAAIERGDRVAPRRRIHPAVFGGLALAAAVLLGIGIGRRQSDDGFAARGGAASASSSLARDVALEVRANGRPIAPGAALPAQTRFDATERNIGAAPAHALVFLVDAASNVHWLYPAYETAGSDPASVTIEAHADRALGTAVAFDDVAPGPASIITLLSRAPLRVSQIESRAGALAPDDLRRAFPAAEVRLVPIRIQ